MNIDLDKIKDRAQAYLDHPAVVEFIDNEEFYKDVLRLVENLKAARGVIREDKALVKADLDELERLERAATPGPWQSLLPNHEGSNFRLQIGDRIWLMSIENSEFIAAMRNAIPQLLHRLRAAESLVKAYGFRCDNAPINCSCWDCKRQTEAHNNYKAVCGEQH